MQYADLIDLFIADIETPQDLTDVYWYKNSWGGLHYSGSKDSANPNTWEGGGYHSDVNYNDVERGVYLLTTLDDGCGGKFQAFFSFYNQIDPEEYE